MKHTYSEQDLRDAVKTSGSLRQVLQKLNIVAAGGNYETTKKRISHYGIDTSHFHGQLWNKGKTIGPKRSIEEYLVNGRYIQSNNLKKRLLSEGLKEHKCECCGITDWNGQPTPIELDHIDGNRYNNVIENLRILCPNCHAQTETYCGKNKSK
jgi:hypothetical protein